MSESIGPFMPEATVMYTHVKGSSSGQRSVVEHLWQCLQIASVALKAAREAGCSIHGVDVSKEYILGLEEVEEFGTIHWEVKDTSDTAGLTHRSQDHRDGAPEGS